MRKDGYLALVCAALAIAPTTAPAQSSSLAFMNGTWSGDGYRLVLDTERMLASIDADLPFQRDFLQIKTQSGAMVVFRIKDKEFIGYFGRDTLTLTSYSLNGQITLRRE